MTSPVYGRGYLGEIASRLQRYLGIKGLLPVDLQPERITPVILVGDCMLPGVGESKLRRWALNFATTGGVGTTGRWLKAKVDIIVDEIGWRYTTTPTQIEIAVLGSADADPVTINLEATASVMLDRLGTSAEKAPVFMSAATDTGGGVDILGVAAVAPNVAGDPGYLRFPFLMARDQKLKVRGVTDIVEWMIRGRVA